MPRVTSVVAFGLVAAATVSLGAAPLPQRTVGVVFDASSTHAGDGSPTHEDLLVRVVDETEALVDDEFTVRFPPGKRRFGAWSIDGINDALDSLLTDPGVDVVLALGPFATAAAMSRTSLPKPVLAPIVIDREVQGAPRRGDASGVRNLNYVTLPLSIRGQLSRFREIVGFESVTFVFDGHMTELLPEVPTRVFEIARELNLRARAIPLTTDAAPLSEQIRGEEGAVVVFPLPRFDEPEIGRVFEAINQARLPSLTFLSDRLLGEGALLSLTTGTNLDRLARRVALNLQRVLLGEDAGALPVVLEQEERLTVNMATARKIGWHPTWDTLVRAELVEERPTDVDRRWTLEDAGREAIRANRLLQSRRHEVAASEWDVDAARASLRPRIEAQARAVKVDEDRAAASFGQQPEQALSAKLQLRQLLWSSRAFGNVAVQEHLQASRAAALEVTTLDVALQASRAFLDVLRARTAYRIRRENVRLTEDNLRLADRRQELGVSGPADVYRWRSELASDRQEAISALQSLQLARISLNRLLHRPPEEEFVALTPEIPDDGAVVRDGALGESLADPWSFRLFRDFMVEEGLQRSPELKEIDQAILAAKAAVTLARRDFWSPDLSLVGEAAKRLAESGAGSDGLSLPLGFASPDDTEWSVALSASIPLYAGGARSAEHERTRQTLRSLEQRREAVREQVDQRVRAALLDALSSASGIRLSAEAASAAKKNLELVRDAYSQGVISILGLLDAQNASIVADQVASNAVFDFLRDMAEVDRATSNFDFLRSQTDRSERDARLEEYRNRAAEGPGFAR